ncbi:MAG TPA: SGNH/GDSL hydrolase family protein [Actinomycetota bacterium]|nr:SGNH/GDSL hydrolase family protein [Actinomycetota bacterium]
MRAGRRWRRLAGAALVVLGACSSGHRAAAPAAPSRAAPSPASSPARSPAPSTGPVVYVAIGASESLGVGSSDPAQDAWPAVFARGFLPHSATFDNVAVSGATVEDALQDQLSQALAAHPTLVTVWLNVNDLIASVTPADYQHELQSLISQLRQKGGTTVLVANTPPLDQLPIYLACRSGSFGLGTGSLCPAPAALDASVDAYNRATSAVVASTGAILVDLHAAGAEAEKDGTYASLVSADGFHPSDAGYALVARTFGAALQKAAAAS